MVKFIRILGVPVLALALFTGAALAADTAESLFKAGERAEHAGDTLHAYLLYVRAAAADPHNAVYAARKAALRGIATMSAKETLGPDPAAPESTDNDADSDPDADEVPDPQGISALEMKQAREALPPPQLIASLEKKTFDLKGDARMIFEKVAGEYGINIVFEADYQSPQPFTFRMSDAGYQDALRGLEAVSDSFLVAIGPKTALVARDTPPKRAEHEPVMAAVIPIPERLSVAEAAELVQAVTATMEIRRITPDPTKHLVYVRDRVSKVIAARQILETLSRARTEVGIEVEFIEAGKTSSLGYGMNLPNELSLVNFGNIMHNAGSIPSGFSTILQFGGGATLLGLGVTNASAFATLANASANNLLRAQIVTLDGQAASLTVGNHYPIITNTYIGNTNTSTNGSSQVFAPPPTVSFEDLGLVLKITPTVHGGDEVTLDIDAAFKVLGASTAVGIPIISNRKFTGKVRLKNGEWAVIAGLVSNTNSDSLTGYPGISDIPFLRRLLGRSTIEKDSTEVLLVLKPRLMNLPPWEYPTKPIWVGTDSRPLTIF